MKNYINLTLRNIGLLCIFALLCTFKISAQGSDSKGTDFWITFPGNFPGTVEVSLFISAEQNTSGTVEIPGVAFSEAFNVTVGNITTIALPVSVLLTTSNAIINNGIHITADDEITIYGLNRQTFTTDAFLGLPTDILGTDYINFGYTDNGNGTQFGLVATQDNTTVTITPTVAADGHAAGVPYDIVMNQGETYLYKVFSVNSDLTGSLITSDKPIALFGGSVCANVPVGVCCCDHIVEELSNTTTWGQAFVTVPLKTRSNGDRFRFLASVDGTNVMVNGVSVANLNKGQFHEMILTAASTVSANNPILVAQYSHSTGFDGVTSDPFMMLIPPFEQFLGSYTINTPATGFPNNFVNVVALNDAVGSIKLDGVVIPAGSFTAIGTSGYSGAQVDVSTGVHNFEGGGFVFGVFVYGFADFDSYGYPGGQSLSPVATVASLNLTPANGSSEIDNEQCFDALVKDQFNDPVVGVRVDFVVTGVSPSSGFANTNSSGIAQYCYTGAVVGDDQITATTGSFSDVSSFTWTDSAVGGTEHKICLKDNYGNKWKLEITRVGDVRYVRGWVYPLVGNPYRAKGFYDYSTAEVQLHAVRPKSDNCQNHYDSFAYFGNGGGYYDHNNGGDPFFGASGTWEAYCHGGKVVDEGEFQLVDCNHNIHLPDPALGTPSNKPVVVKPLITMLASPNPMINTTKIDFVMEKKAQVQMVVYNYMQQPLKVLVNEVKNAGKHSIVWDGRISNGTKAIPGIYKIISVIDGKSYSTNLQVLR